MSASPPVAAEVGVESEVKSQAGPIYQVLTNSDGTTTKRLVGYNNPVDPEVQRKRDEEFWKPGGEAFLERKAQIASALIKISNGGELTLSEHNAVVDSYEGVFENNAARKLVRGEPLYETEKSRLQRMLDRCAYAGPTAPQPSMSDMIQAVYNEMEALWPSRHEEVPHK